jgi:hypothetical protein
MKNIGIVGVFLSVFFLAGCSAIPSRSQVQMRKTTDERLEDAVRDREREFHDMRGTSRENPSPGI